MRLLTLVRHAKSSWDYAELTDFERPLNERGRRDAPAMAQSLRKRIGRPDRIVSSPALRAITTARIFAEALGTPLEDIAVQPQIYEASPETLLKVLRGLDDRDRHVMLFGHNPGFSELAHELAHCNFDELPTCAVAQFELAVRVWGEVNYGCGTLLHYTSPKKGG